MDEVFGERNCAGQVIFSKTTGQSGGAIPSVSDYLLWYAKDLDNLKRRNISIPKPPIDNPKERYVCVEPRLGEIVDLSLKQKTGEEKIPDGRTSRVAPALARARIMGARYPYYLLADSPEGQQKEAEIAGKAPPDTPTHGNVRLGFVYERVPHITLKSIANNAEIDVIWERWQETLEPLRANLDDALGRTWEEWAIPREPGDPWPDASTSAWNKLGAAETVQAKEAALRSLNRALNRHYTLDNVPNAPRDPWEPAATRPSHQVVGGSHRPPAGDRRLHRSQGRLRVPVRQTL